MFMRRLTWALAGLFIAGVIVYQQVTLVGLRTDLARAAQTLTAGVGAIQNDVDELKKGQGALREALARAGAAPAAAAPAAGDDRAEFDKFARRAGLDARQREGLWPAVRDTLAGLRALVERLQAGGMGRAALEAERRRLADRLAARAKEILTPQQAKLFATIVREIREGAGAGR